MLPHPSEGVVDVYAEAADEEGAEDAVRSVVERVRSIVDAS